MTLLTIELVPSSCWFSNVRSHVTARQWNQCKMYVRDRSGDHCEICGGRGRKWPVECHEIWRYDAPAQVLDGLIALCPACHECKHLGFAEIRGRGPQALAHLMKVNDWTYQETDIYIANCFEVWNARSQLIWELDISWLETELGIVPKLSPGSSSAAR